MLVVETITDPVYVSEDGGKIDCRVKFASMAEPVNYTADVNDPDQTSVGPSIYAHIVAGNTGEISPYVTPIAKRQKVVQSAPQAQKPPNVIG